MNLINQSAWGIGREHQIETDLEQALLEKIEHMEVEIEELKEDLDKEKESHSNADDDWATRFSEMKEELQARIIELEGEVEDLNDSLKGYGG